MARRQVGAFGAAPYAEYTAMEAVAAIAAGYRMKKPDMLYQDVYDKLLMECWRYGLHCCFLFSLKLVDFYPHSSNPDLAIT